MSLLTRVPASAMGIFGAFFFRNAFYIVKYGARAGLPAVPGFAGYALLFAVQCAAALWVARSVARSARPRTWLIVLVAAYLGLAALLYSRIDPLQLANDRWSALQYFFDALFRGEFPWSVRTHLGGRISGFPGLFLLAFPFYLIGDVGLLQFVALIALVALTWVRLRDAGRPTFLTVLLVGTPVFSYQIFCRSDLAANMIAAAWLVHFSERGDARGMRILFWGAAWGLMLSTRAIVVVPLILAAFRLLRGRRLGAYVGFGAAVAATFGATFLPFYLWNPEAFIEHNPWMVQSGYAPKPFLAAILLLTAWLGWRHRGSERLLRDAGWILFAVTVTSWILRSVELGWGNAFWRHGFDVTYFFIPVPFLLLALGEGLSRPGRRLES